MLANALYYVLVFVFGSAIGSFLNVVTQRAPQEQSLGGRSHCLRCKHQLQAADLVPVLSYVLLRGQCRYCGAKISQRYVLFELATGALFLLVAVLAGVPLTVAAAVSLVREFFVVSVLVLVFVIDLEHYVILDKVVFPSCIVLLLFNLATPGLLVPSLLAAAGAAGFFLLLYVAGQRRWIGFGDVKLGLFLGLATPGLVVVANIFLAYVIGAAVAIPLLVFGKKHMASAVPFGTFLAVSTFITLCFGSQLVAWYLHLVGV